MKTIFTRRSAIIIIALVLLMSTTIGGTACAGPGPSATPTAGIGPLYGGVDVSTLKSKALSMVSHFDPGVDREQTSIGAAAIWWKEELGGTFELTIVAADIYPIKVMAMIGSGAPPDIIVADSRGWMPKLAVMNVLQPVDDLVDRSTLMDNEKRLYDFYTWKGKHFAAYVMGAWGYSMWYNKTLFTTNGVKTPREYWDEGNWDWDTFLQVAQELTQDTDKDGVIDQWGYANWGVEIFPAANYARMTEVTNDGQVKVIWDQKPFVEAAQFEQDLMNKYKVWSPDLGFQVQNFKAGKVAMSAGANDFPQAFCTDMKDEFDNAPFPLGPNQDKNDIKYLGFSLFLGFGNGAKNLDGARAFVAKMREAELDHRANNVIDPKSSIALLTQEQIDTCEFVDSKVVLNYDSGFGDWETKRWAFWADVLFSNVPIATAMQTHLPTLESEIKATLDSTFVSIERFKPVPAETFESGDLSKSLLTQEGLEGISTELKMSLTTSDPLDGTTSLKFENPSADGWLVLARTDDTKIKLPAYHRYVIKFDYKVLTDSAANLYLTMRPKASMNSEDIAFGFLKVACKPGEKGSFEGAIDVMESSVDNVLLLLLETADTTLVIDNFEITEG